MRPEDEEKWMKEAGPADEPEERTERRIDVTNEECPGSLAQGGVAAPLSPVSAAAKRNEPGYAKHS